MRNMAAFNALTGSLELASLLCLDRPTAEGSIAMKGMHGR